MKHPQISWVLNDEGSIEMDPDTYVKYKSLLMLRQVKIFLPILKQEREVLIGIGVV
jgi:hypothetical protein